MAEDGVGGGTLERAEAEEGEGEEAAEAEAVSPPAVRRTSRLAVVRSLVIVVVGGGAA